MRTAKETSEARDVAGVVLIGINGRWGRGVRSVRPTALLCHSRDSWRAVKNIDARKFCSVWAKVVLAGHGGCLFNFIRIGRWTVKVKVLEVGKMHTNVFMLLLLLLLLLNPQPQGIEAWPNGQKLRSSASQQSKRVHVCLPSSSSTVHLPILLCRRSCHDRQLVEESCQFPHLWNQLELFSFQRDHLPLVPVAAWTSYTGLFMHPPVMPRNLISHSPSGTPALAKLENASSLSVRRKRSTCMWRISLACSVMVVNFASDAQAMASQTGVTM